MKKQLLVGAMLMAAFATPYTVHADAEMMIEESTGVTHTENRNTPMENTQPEPAPQEMEEDTTPVEFDNDEIRKSVNRALINEENLIDPTQKSEIDIKTYQPTVKDMKNLKKLHISGLYSYSDVAEENRTLKGLEKAVNLEYLHLGYSEIKDHSAIEALQKLKTLSLPGNNLKNIDILRNMNALEIVNLRSNDLDNIDVLSGKTKMKDLNISENRIQNLDALQSMQDLEVVSALNNQIQNIRGIMSLTKIKSLNLDSNLISSLDGIGEKPNIEVLDVSNNKIASIDPISPMHTLRYLSIIGNKVIEDLSPLKNMTNLEALSIRDNNVTNIDALENLTNLKDLHLYENKIEDISKISKLVNLRELNISKNKVKDISAVKDMQHLRIFFAYQNLIEDPSILWNLKNLRIANISENRIYNLKTSSIQQQPEHRESFVADQGVNEIILRQKLPTINQDENFVTWRIANPIQDINQKYVSIDSSKEEAFDEWNEYLNRSIKMYNDGIKALKEQNIRIKTVTNEETDDTIEISVPKDYFEKNKDAFKIDLHFFQREGIPCDYYETDSPDYLAPIVKGEFIDYPLKEGDKYELTNPFSGKLTVSFLWEEEQPEVPETPEKPENPSNTNENEASPTEITETATESSAKTLPKTGATATGSIASVLCLIFGSLLTFHESFTRKKK